MDTTLTASFAELLKQYRTAVTLSQEGLAERAGVSPRAISDLERGLHRAPYPDTIRLLADALGLDVEARARLIAAAVRQRLAIPAPPEPKRAVSGLPVPLTPLLGRERDEESVMDLLMQPNVRLMTLTGPGGVGKTRLAIQIASGLSVTQPQCVGFVELAGIRNATLVLPTIIQELGLRVEPGRDLVEVVAAHVGATRSLLVLDNFEHLTSAAEQVTDLLAACPLLKIMVTSRAPLHVHGEQQFAVPPLALPSLETNPTLEALTQAPSVQLFVQRVQALRPAFSLSAETGQVVAAICRRLDGLPLAIELAAARSNVLSPKALLERLERHLPVLSDGPRDMPARQRSLRHTIAWSYDLLAPHEQALFRRMAVFTDGCTLEAAETVCADRTTVDSVLDAAAVFEGVVQLVRQSLLRVDDQGDDEPRFTMLETLREYGQEQLAAIGEAATMRRRHAAFFLTVAEQAEPHLRTPQRARWLVRLEAELSNLRSALQWAQVDKESGARLQLAAALWRFWFLTGRSSEGRSWLESGLAANPDVEGAQRAKALDASGALAQSQGNYATAHAHHGASLPLWREIGDKRGIAGALGSLGLVLKAEGELDQAAALLEESLALWRELGDTTGTGMLLNNLSIVALEREDYFRAETLQMESLALKRRQGDTSGIAYSLNNLAECARYQGNYTTAETMLTEGLGLARELGGNHLIAHLLHSLAMVALRLGDAAQAATFIGESFQLFRELEEQPGIALCLEGMAALAAARSDDVRAPRLLAAAEGLRVALGAPLPPADQAERDSVLEKARQRLPHRKFAAAWAAGQAMPLEATLAYAASDPA